MGIKVPLPTENENKLRQIGLDSAYGVESAAQQQGALTDQELAMWDEMQPIFMQEAGFQQNTDPTTGKTSWGLTDDARRLQAAQSATAAAQAEATQRAVTEGDYRANPALERELKENEARLRTRNQQLLGSGYETSTPGMQALAFNTQASTEAREGDRRYQLTAGQELSNSLEQNRAAKANRMAGLASLSGDQKQESIGAKALTYGGSADTATNTQSPYQFDRTMEMQKQLAAYEAKTAKHLAKKDRKAALHGALIGVWGDTSSAVISSAGSMGGGAAAAGSHPDTKDIYEQIYDEAMLEAISNQPVYRWNYKAYPEQQYIGSMTTDMPDQVIVGDLSERKEFSMISYLGMLTAAIRALNQQVQELKAAKQGETSYA